MEETLPKDGWFWFADTPPNAEFPACELNWPNDGPDCWAKDPKPDCWPNIVVFEPKTAPEEAGVPKEPGEVEPNVGAPPNAGVLPNDGAPPKIAVLPIPEEAVKKQDKLQQRLRRYTYTRGVNS